jgi:hypothetical protein
VSRRYGALSDQRGAPARRRVTQFFRATFARVRADERDQIEGWLTPAQAALFYRMARSDQRHCLDVYHTLLRAGHKDEYLLRAALLHDAGKGSPAVLGGRPGGGWPMTVWHRVAIVLLQAFTWRDAGLRWLARLAADGRGWKAPFGLHARHAEAGARWAEEAGCAPEVVALIRDHHGDRAGGEEERLCALRWADERN